MSWIPLVGGSLSVLIGGLLADFAVRKYGSVVRVFVIMASLVIISFLTVATQATRTRLLVSIEAALPCSSRWGGVLSVGRMTTAT